MRWEAAPGHPASPQLSGLSDKCPPTRAQGLSARSPIPSLLRTRLDSVALNSDLDFATKLAYSSVVWGYLCPASPQSIFTLRELSPFLPKGSPTLIFMDYLIWDPKISSL